MKNRISNRPATDKVSTLSNHSNHSAEYDYERITLPLPPATGEEARFEMEIYARFMRHLRHVPNSRMEIKILSAIQFTADMMEEGDALVSKMLVDMGLRAPRKAFPVAFLDFADKSARRTGWQQGTPPHSVLKLQGHWSKIGEDRFAHNLPGQYTVYNESNYVSV